MKNIIIILSMILILAAAAGMPWTAGPIENPGSVYYQRIEIDNLRAQLIQTGQESDMPEYEIKERN